jgi:hypothetical protein
VRPSAVCAGGSGTAGDRARALRMGIRRGQDARLDPLLRAYYVAHSSVMVQLTIRCHPRVPVAAEQLERWLDQQVEGLRAEAPLGTVRLSRLTQQLPSVGIGIGWLLELELPEDEPLLDEDRLAAVLRDMRLLGLQPTLFTAQELSAWSARRRDGACKTAGSADHTNGAAP